MRELAEAPAVSAFRARFEAGRSFDLDDDLEFCPNLLTEDDVRSTLIPLIMRLQSFRIGHVADLSPAAFNPFRFFRPVIPV